MSEHKRTPHEQLTVAHGLPARFRALLPDERFNPRVPRLEPCPHSAELRDEE